MSDGAGPAGSRPPDAATRRAPAARGDLPEAAVRRLEANSLLLGT